MHPLLFFPTSMPSAYTPTMGEHSPPPELLRRLNDANLNRLVMRRYRRRNIIVGLGLLGGVVGIYTYSMLAVKQETFLDEEFDIPGPVQNSQDNR